MGLSQCSRPVSPVDPLVPAAPCTTLPPFPCLVPVIPPCAKAALDTSAPAIARPESRTARLALMNMPYLSLLEPARPVDFLGDTPPHACDATRHRRRAPQIVNESSTGRQRENARKEGARADIAGPKLPRAAGGGRGRRIRA